MNKEFIMSPIAILTHLSKSPLYRLCTIFLPLKRLWHIFVIHSFHSVSHRNKGPIFSSATMRQSPRNSSYLLITNLQFKFTIEAAVMCIVIRIYFDTVTLLHLSSKLFLISTVIYEIESRSCHLSNNPFLKSSRIGAGAN